MIQWDGRLRLTEIVQYRAGCADGRWETMTSQTLQRVAVEMARQYLCGTLWFKWSGRTFTQARPRDLSDPLHAPAIKARREDQLPGIQSRQFIQSMAHRL